MTSESQTAATQVSEPTEARFSTRSLFIGMAVVAVLAAIVGPLVRALEPPKQVRLLATLALWLAATLACIAYQARRRFEAERMAGATLLRLPMFDPKVGTATPTRWWFHLFGCAFVSLIMLLFVSQAVLQPPGNPEPWHYLFVFGLYGSMSIWWAARTVTLFWWRSAIRFCDHGILWDGRLVRWPYIIQRRWSGTDESVLEIKGIDQRNVELGWKVPVPADRRDMVRALLEEKMPEALPAPSGPSVLELGHIPLSTAVKSPHFPKYLVGTLIRIPAFIALFVIIARNPTGVREFDGMIFPGFLVAAFLPIVRRKFFDKDAGPPLVRITGRRGWSGLVLYAAVAAIIFWVGAYLGSASFIVWEWPFRVLGLACGSAVAVTLQYSYSKFVDLRASGISLPGELFWPWEQIRIIRWNRDDSGRLVLARGLRRVIATVPSEQREAVDRVLNEKLSLA
jgi:hypothetical protein